MVFFSSQILYNKSHTINSNNGVLMSFNDNGQISSRGISKTTFCFCILFFFIFGYLADAGICFVIKKLEEFIENDKELSMPQKYLLKPEILSDGVHPLVIIGGGAAGFTAAVYAAQAGYKPLLFVGKKLGGALAKTVDVRNWPGEQLINGAKLTNQWKEQAVASGAILEEHEVLSVDFSVWPYLITSRDLVTGSTYYSKALSCILSTGATPNYLSIPGEQEFWGNGVTNCAICDSHMVKGATAVIVGGGDSAMAEAQILANVAKEVFILVRGKTMRSKEIYKKTVGQRSNVKIIFETQPLEIIGNSSGVTSIKVQTKNEQPYSIDTTGVFLAIGSKPNVSLFKSQLDIGSDGCLKLFKGQQTSKDAVFAAGDVSSPIFRQAVIAAGDGCRAALQAMIFLNNCGARTDIFSGKTFLDYSAGPTMEETVEDKSPDFSGALDLKEEDSGADIVSDLIDNSQAEELKIKIFEISTEDEFSEKLKMVKTEDKILILDFFGTWCAPCKTIEKVLKKIAIDFADKVIICKINVDNSSSLTSSFKVRGVPTLLFFDGDGVEINRLVGARDYEEIASIINNNQK